jgi:phosphoglycerate dehydrogenase-like enzyme
MPQIVLVTEPEYRRAPWVFEGSTAFTCVIAPPDEDALAQAIKASGARHVVIGGKPYKGPLYASLARGAVVARFGVGHEGVDKPQATKYGLLCTNTPHVLDQSVAELTFLLVAAAARHLPAIAGAFQQRRWDMKQGAELSGKTLTVVGAGRIGSAVARIASRGYDMRCVAYRRAQSSSPRVGEEFFAETTTDLAKALGEADYVVVLIPGVPENTHFFNRERLALMRPHAWLINTARGVVVDEAALYDVLAAGQIAGAAIDVFQREPYEPADPAKDFRTLSNVILTPHVGSHTPEANGGMASRALQNILHAEAGDFSRMDLLNPEVLQNQ